MDLIHWNWWLEFIASGGAGPSSGDGILLEDETSFLQLESGDFFLLES